MTVVTTVSYISYRRVVTTVSYISYRSAYCSIFSSSNNKLVGLNGRNFNVSFTSNVLVEVMVFIFYSDEVPTDVKSGPVTRHKN